MRRQLGILIAGLGLLSAVALAAVGTLKAQSGEEADIEFSGISGEVASPRRHRRIRNPAELTSEQAQRIYDIIAGALEKGYGESGQRITADYQDWRRYNTAPYRSAAHGNHYLNNYANNAARPYGRFERAGEMPVGSIIAKDSFTVTRAGEIVLGPLAMMEKMPEGFNYVSGDWRFTQIQPDGTLLGQTNGQDAERVEYCIGCHLAAEQHDYLFFLPKESRIETTSELRAPAGTGKKSQIREKKRER